MADEDDQGGPDDPGSYYRRLRTKVDQGTSRREMQNNEGNPDMPNQ